jgi:2-aminoadipate transaminase
MTGFSVDLSRGIPPIEAFPVEDLLICGISALRHNAHVLLQYGGPWGYTPLREWLANEYRVSIENVLLSNSSLQILAFIIQTFVSHGDRVFVESPTYDLALNLLRKSQCDIVGIPMMDDGIDLDVLEQQIQIGMPSLIYLITDFQNPTGITTSFQKRKHLAELTERYGLMIVEDTPYRALRYEETDLPTLWSLAPDHVIQVSSFSKILTPGLRLGYALGVSSWIDKLAASALASYIGPVLPTQGLVYEYCQQGLLNPQIQRLRELYGPRLQTTLSLLTTYMPQASWYHPLGGYFVGVNLPTDKNITTLRLQAIASGIQLIDGHIFFPRFADGDRFLRIPFCNVDSESMAIAIRHVSTLI